MRQSGAAHRISTRCAAPASKTTPVRSRARRSKSPTTRSTAWAICSTKLRPIDEPKTVVLISEGFVVDDMSDLRQAAWPDGGGGARQPVRAASQRDGLRLEQRTAAAVGDRGPPDRRRRSRSAGERGARLAVDDQRCRHPRVRSPPDGDLRLLPGRHPARSARSRRQGASHPDRSAVERRRRAVRAVSW